MSLHCLTRPNIKRSFAAVALPLACLAAAGCADQGSDTRRSADEVAAETEGAESCAFPDRSAVTAEAKRALPDLLTDRAPDPTTFAPGMTWRYLSARPFRGACAVTFDTCTTLSSAPDEVFCGDLETYEVVAFKDGQFRRFEEAFQPPAELLVGIGRQSPSPGKTDLTDPLWYAKLTGQSVLDANKSLAAQINMCGLLGKVDAKNITVVGSSVVGEPTGAADFDPTPGRQWKLAEAEFVLNRGSTAEVMDINSGSFDVAFGESYTATGGGGIGPWEACFLRRFNAGDAWVDVDVMRQAEELRRDRAAATAP
jgi:hypothetical protein